MAVGCVAAQKIAELNARLDGRHVQLHIGDPGAACTANVAGVTTRYVMAWGAAVASSGTVSKTQTGSLTWSGWTGGTQTISHLSFWDAATGGTPVMSIALASGLSVINGQSVTITGGSVSSAVAA